ncbi:hypothetical protein ZTR_03151 [Talaromyces verruculosus]|nr:hypothetical protein ZTR_03151 [Talaromyces verruculosus]
MVKRGPKIGSHQSAKRKRRCRDSSCDGPANGPKRPGQGTSVPSDESVSERVPADDQLATLPTSRTTCENILAISFNIHFSHEAFFPKDYSQFPQMAEGMRHGDPLLTSTCSAIGITPALLKTLLAKYFEDYTSFRLFREPTFLMKLQQIESMAQCSALVAAVLSFAARTARETVRSEFLEDHGLSRISSESHFRSLATTYIEEAIKECGDDPVPFPVLQALILMTHWRLIFGVRGRAWRDLGTCVRLAYELNLHLIDCRGEYDNGIADVNQWCEDEEKRRAWWAIWEMDVFASVVRRGPLAIDWSQVKIFLPAEDEKWFQGRPQRSSMLEAGVIDRVMALRASGNQSPFAWYLIAVSLVKEAQKVSSPMGIMKIPLETYWTSTGCVDHGSELGKRLSELDNALKHYALTLPTALRYGNQGLSFSPSVSSEMKQMTSRHLHSAIYNIHIMVQLTKLMAYKYFIFHNGASWQIYSPDDSTHNCLGRFSSKDGDDYLHQYFRAADSILTIVERSSEDHYKYVNPFVANAIWLAGAIKLLQRAMASPGVRSDLTNSNFELLRVSYCRFVEYWKISNACQSNLTTLEHQLGLLLDTSYVSPTETSLLYYAMREEGSIPTRPCFPTSSQPIIRYPPHREQGPYGSQQQLSQLPQLIFPEEALHPVDKASVPIRAQQLQSTQSDQLNAQSAPEVLFQSSESTSLLDDNLLDYLDRSIFRIFG